MESGSQMRFKVTYSFSFDLEKIVYANSDKSILSKFIEWQKKGKVLTSLKRCNG